MKKNHLLTNKWGTHIFVIRLGFLLALSLFLLESCLESPNPTRSMQQVQKGTDAKASIQQLDRQTENLKYVHGKLKNIGTSTDIQQPSIRKIKQEESSVTLANKTTLSTRVTSLNFEVFVEFPSLIKQQYYKNVFIATNIAFLTSYADV